MDSQPPLDLAGPTDGDTTLTLADYAQTAYLEYALSVVKGRALPDVSDGQKPVQRRILYSMSRMGLGFGGTNGTVGAKPVKSARVVGDVLGRFHPHSDQAAYDALVRMAQDFSQRYPLVDGQGNFGSRDGDGAAAMRYTEARLARITSLLLDEIDEGTVDFIPNYDGSTEEPRLLPARLPFTLLNGASGIAVGLATEIPSHNLREIADACVALIKSNGKLSEEELLAIVPGPDYPGGAQIISGASDIADAYRTGRGSLKVRARWKIEELARGQWQLVVNELPPGVSTQKVLEEIEEITNPKVKTGKKALSADQTQLKAAMLSMLDVVRDESSKDAAVRLVFEPKTSRISQDEFITTLLAQTSLETSSSINLTMVGIDGKPTQKSLRQMLTEWIAFREITVEKRSRHRLNKVLERIHILEGRQLVLLNIDEVIAIIRAAEDPKAALIARFNLSEIQAEDILEIRLRQLARLEAIKIEQQLKELREDQKKLEDILGNPATLRRLLIKEIETDAKTFEDPRRTLIQAEKRAIAEVKVVDEPVTVIVSQKGWVRAQKGWASEKAAAANGANGEKGTATPEYSFKSGDTLYGAFECRSVDTLLVFGSSKDKTVRVYTVPVASLPGARGDGQPVTTLVELDAGTHVTHFFAGPVGASVLLANTGGYGFIATVENMMSRQRGGKAFIDVGEGEQLCRPSLVGGASGAEPMAAATHVACASTGGRILTFDITELKSLPKGGRGLTLIDLEDKDTLAGAAAYTRSVKIEGIGRGAKEREETLEIRTLNNARGTRARKGKAADLGFKPTSIVRVL
ncbi:DNA topoisomerase IV subunit A [Variovorax sp. PAMC26660]|uniref:DNA topoisomerase IV subunit A n=1 Tax=Variovorax sp. PAMC26660 TaxID=2762322 RepID=UPI00164DD4CA|nr:DNA topoisomerase IV subunit A [Variovorax sp. PAMC26660]QNK66221.1 DNA topoisomerase IV subunit A [Variovorax sp. PAMC26660]